MSTYSEDMVYRLWNDDSGERIEVSTDSDGLSLIEIKNHDANGDITHFLSITHDQAIWLTNILSTMVKRQAPHG
jgi:hypothetical protein